MLSTARGDAVRVSAWPPATDPPDRSTRVAATTHTGRGPRARGRPGPLPISTGTVELERDPDDPDGVTVLVNGVPSSYLDLADPPHLVVRVHAADGRGDRPGRRRPAGRSTWCTSAPPAARWPARSTPNGPGPDSWRSSWTPPCPSWSAAGSTCRARPRCGSARATRATELEKLPDASADVVVRDVFAGDTTPRARPDARDGRAGRAGAAPRRRLPGQHAPTGRRWPGRAPRSRRSTGASRTSSSSPSPGCCAAAATATSCIAASDDLDLLVVARRSRAPSAACPRRPGCCATRSSSAFVAGAQELRDGPPLT